MIPAMKLTARYNRLIIPSISIVFLLSIVCSYFLIRQVLQRELDGSILRSKGRIEVYIRNNKALPGINAFDDQIIHFEKQAGPLADSGFHSTMQYIAEQRKDHISRSLVFAVGLNNERWKVTISQPLEGTSHLTALIAKVAIATILVMLLLLILINRRVSNKLWAPFYHSLAQIRIFDINNGASLVFPDSNIEEFQLMNTHFRQAAENAIRDYRMMKEFSANASHEIQTPLAIMRSNLDLILQEDLTEKQSESFKFVYSAVSRLSKLQESLLLLTKIDNNQFAKSEDLRLDQAVMTKIGQFQELWHNKQISSSADLAPTVIHTNRELLDILLNNLFSNATRHNFSGGALYAELKEDRLTIGNTGPNQSIDPDRLFRRFHKNSSQSENNGLGLSIIKQICDTSSLKVVYKYDNGWHKFTILL
jgi:signal transduction histidine kinase